MVMESGSYPRKVGNYYDKDNTFWYEACIKDTDGKYYYVNDIFALVARRDGHFEVILAPFDVNTLRKVDVDILKEIA